MKGYEGMKKSIASVIAALLAVSMFAACGNGEEKSESPSETAEQVLSDSSAAETEGSTEAETAQESQNVKTKLTDIVGDRYDWLNNQYASVSCADITRSQRIELISDLIYCDEILSLVTSYDLSDFCAEDSILETIYENEVEYHFVYSNVATDLDEMYNVARKCFTESWISDDELEQMMFVGDHPQFKMIDGWLANLIVYPIQKKSIYLDYENAGVISYSDTSAVVWIANRNRFEYGGNVEEYHMERDSVNDMWRFDGYGRPYDKIEYIEE